MTDETLFDYIKSKLNGITEMPLGVLALCPFHEEKTASFYVSARKQSFECIGCGARGDSKEAFDRFLKS